MKLEIVKKCSFIFGVALLFFFLDIFILKLFLFPKFNKTFNFSLTYVFAVFTFFSVLISATLEIVKNKNKDIVGMTFMLMTTFKALLLYIIFFEIVNNENGNKVEKYNFFVVFIMFLLLETLNTIRLLNKNE